MLRLLRTGRVDRLSLTAWRAMLVVNLIWTAPGLNIGQLPQVLTSALSLCSTIPILYLIARELRRHLLMVLVPALLGAGVLICADQFFGSAAIIPAVVANAPQTPCGPASSAPRRPPPAALSDIDRDDPAAGCFRTPVGSRVRAEVPAFPDRIGDQRRPDEGLRATGNPLLT